MPITWQISHTVKCNPQPPTIRHWLADITYGTTFNKYHCGEVGLWYTAHSIFVFTRDKDSNP
jgi:hypothetical protein